MPLVMKKPLVLQPHSPDRKSQPGIRTCIAWFNAGTEPDTPSIPGRDVCKDGASAMSADLGFGFEEFSVGDGSRLRQLHQRLQDRGVRGILLPTGELPEPSRIDFPWEEYAVVRFGASVRNQGTNRVGANDHSNTQLAFLTMRERGYRRIGLAMMPSPSDGHNNVISAAFACMQETIDASERISEFSIPDIADRFLPRLLRQWVDAQRPDAVFSNHPRLLHLLESTGLRVPLDIGLAATNVSDSGIDSGIEPNPGEIGRAAVQLLRSLLVESDCGLPGIIRTIVILGKWIDGTCLPSRVER
jgi:DNA-binding LacI/PurR family transcriptional regulator